MKEFASSNLTSSDSISELSKLYVSKRGLIVEVATNLPILKVEKRHQRNKWLAKLNGGAGFGGRTPTFFALKNDAHI